MGGGGEKAKIEIEQGKQFVHQKSLEKKFVQRLFNRENYKLTGPNGVRKNFLNLNVADIGAKNRFKHVLTRICQGKCVLNHN